MDTLRQMPAIGSECQTSFSSPHVVPSIVKSNSVTPLKKSDEKPTENAALVSLLDSAFYSSKPFLSEEEQPPTKKQRKVQDASSDTKKRKFRPYQAEKWHERFEELIEYEKENKHCLVPHSYEPNPELARWVKRQRYQYNLLHKGKNSTMTQERIKLLEDIGFVWDSHEASWQERLQELISYKNKHGNCDVPSKAPSNPQLATWVKCQRRQYKLFTEGRPSNMSVARILSLEEHGFKWELRPLKNKKKTLNDQEPKETTVSNFASLDKDCEILMDVLDEIDGDFDDESDMLFNEDNENKSAEAKTLDEILPEDLLGDDLDPLSRQADDFCADNSVSNAADVDEFDISGMFDGQGINF